MFKPMLAATLENPETLSYPVLVSPKLDGLRCVIRDGKALSRNLKPFRNLHVQEILRGLPDGLDGELIVGSPTEGHVLNRTQSGIMSTGGKPEFTYHVFDNYGLGGGFHRRLHSLYDVKHQQVAVVEHTLVKSSSEFTALEHEFLSTGYEGIMSRSEHGEYKHGRSRLSEGGLAKFKRFTDGEGRVVEVLEGVHNLNEPTLDALGRTKRSHHQENKVGSSQVGTIMTQMKDGIIRPVSPGRMTHAMRQFYFTFPEKIIGRVIKYKIFDYGVKDAPRFNTFQDFRDPADI